MKEKMLKKKKYVSSTFSYVSFLQRLHRFVRYSNHLHILRVNIYYSVLSHKF